LSSAGDTGGVTVAVDGPVARVTIDNAPARNALAPNVVAGLDVAVEQVTGTGCSVAVVRGAGGTLSAGADLKHLLTALDDPAAVRAYITSIGTALDRLAAAPFVSVCVVDGYAVAGGCEIMLACDLAVASEQAAIGDRHLEYGLLPGAGGSVRLTRALPPVLARRLLYTAEIVDGRTAYEFGLVSHVATAAELESTVDALVARLARHAPDALAAMKRLHSNARTADPAGAINDERETLLAHLGSATVREGLSAFAERRPPDFRHTARSTT
jgi:enoyl-CoA hydratase